jgi:hypothetical protein
MTISITKVKKQAMGLQEITVEKTPAWRAALAYIRRDIARLQKFAFVVERRIERGEPWPAQSTDQKTEQHHSV